MPDQGSIATKGNPWDWTSTGRLPLTEVLHGVVPEGRQSFNYLFGLPWALLTNTSGIQPEQVLDVLVIQPQGNETRLTPVVASVFQTFTWHYGTPSFFAARVFSAILPP